MAQEESVTRKHTAGSNMKILIVENEKHKVELGVMMVNAHR